MHAQPTAACCMGKKRPWTFQKFDLKENGEGIHYHF